MQTFSLSKKKILIRSTMFILVLLVLERIVGFALSPASSYTRLAMHEFYSQQENIDFLFVGPSTTYSFFVPEVFDHAFGNNTFNLGSSSQPMTATYYTLKEVYRTGNKPKKVFIGLVPEALSFQEGDPVFATTLMYHYFELSYNKWKFFLDAFKGDSMLYAISPACMYLNLNFGLSNVINSPANIISKLSHLTDSYSYEVAVSTDGSYKGKGFVYRTQKGDIVPSHIEWSEDKVDENEIKYLQKISALCNESGAELYIVLTPRPIASISCFDNYDSAHNYFENLCNDLGAELLDFNLIKKDVMLRPDALFYDMNHIIGAGAETFSAVLADIVKASDSGILDKNKYFYSSADEALDDLNGEVLLNNEYE